MLSSLHVLYLLQYVRLSYVHRLFDPCCTDRDRKSMAGIAFHPRRLDTKVLGHNRPQLSKEVRSSKIFLCVRAPQLDQLRDSQKMVSTARTYI